MYEAQQLLTKKLSKETSYRMTGYRIPGYQFTSLTVSLQGPYLLYVFE